MKTPIKPDWLVLEEGEEYIRPLWRKPSPQRLLMQFVSFVAVSLLLTRPIVPGTGNPPPIPLWIGLIAIVALFGWVIKIYMLVPAGHLTTRRIFNCFGLDTKAKEIRLEKVTGAIPDFFPSVSSLFNWLDVYYLDENNKQTQRGFEIRQQKEISELIKHLAVKEKLRLGDHIGASMLLGREDFYYEPKGAANGEK